MPVSDGSDVIVIGAGIIGCAVACELGRRGAAVRVLESRDVGRGATQASAGILAPFIEAHRPGPLRTLGAKSLELWDDFAARVRTAGGGERQVLIEIQKTNAPTVVERFRTYLGQQMCSPANVVTHPSGRREAAPIVTIYLLGYDLGISDEAVLDVCPQATERRTGAALDAGHPFIAGIHHRSHVVQIPRLQGRRRDDLERVLSIFDQGEARIERGGAQVLTIDESAYPQEYAFVLRQLQRAASEAEVRRFMEGEDQLLRDSISWGRQAEYERREKERERREKEHERSEKERERREKEHERSEKERERHRAERAEQALSRSIRHLHGLGQDAEAIAGALSIDADEVRRVLAEDGGERSS